MRPPVLELIDAGKAISCRDCLHRALYPPRAHRCRQPLDGMQGFWFADGGMEFALAWVFMLIAQRCSGTAPVRSA